MAELCWPAGELGQVKRVPICGHNDAVCPSVVVAATRRAANITDNNNNNSSNSGSNNNTDNDEHARALVIAGPFGWRAEVARLSGCG